MTSDELRNWLTFGNSIAQDWWIRTNPPAPPATVLGQIAGTDFSRTASPNAGLLLLAIVAVAVFAMRK